jgi:3-methyl-2-oxobutanoate hydroxymethyltransferase
MSEQKPDRVTVPLVMSRKGTGDRIAVLTAYDYPTAAILDACGIDIILVGDSLGMAVLGYDTTIPVTMEEMLHHTRAVTRAASRALVIGDMPYFSFHLSVEQALINASRFLKEAGAHGVKIEGASRRRLEVVEALTDAEIPVMGHVGLTPQSIRRLGQYKVKGADREEADKILKGARDLEKAGAFAIVLESVPMEVAGEVTAAIGIPTIGIGAGPRCDGQVLVLHDMVGFSSGYLPRFVKKYADVQAVLTGAVRAYAEDVRKGVFPDDTTSYHLRSDASAGAPKAKKGSRR